MDLPLHEDELIQRDFPLVKNGRNAAKFVPKYWLKFKFQIFLNHQNILCNIHLHSSRDRKFLMKFAAPTLEHAHN